MMSLGALPKSRGDSSKTATILQLKTNFTPFPIRSTYIIPLLSETCRGGDSNP
jgi:hypothetical protein